MIVKAVVGRCGIGAALCLACLCLSLNATGVEMLTSTNEASWNRVYAKEVIVSWDWSWEWVPAEAVSVRVTISGARNHRTYDQVFARNAETYVMLDIGEVTAVSEDIYTATLTFLDDEGGALYTRSAELYALAGSFGCARVCTQSVEHPDWHKVADCRLIPYDVCWFETTAEAMAGQLSVVPTGAAPIEFPFTRRSGVMAVKGYGETALTMTFDAVGAEPLTASVWWNLSGLLIIFR